VCKVAKGDIVPQEVQDAIEAGALITGGLAGVFSFTSLGLSVIESDDPLAAVASEAGVPDVEKGMTKMEKCMERLGA